MGLALLGSLLKIRPILYVNDGMTDVEEKSGEQGGYKEL